MVAAIYLLNSFISSRFTRSEPEAFLFLMRKYCWDSVFVHLVFTFSDGPEVKATANYKTLLPKVLRTKKWDWLS